MCASVCAAACVFVHFPIRWGREHYSFPFISNIIFYKRIIIFSTLTRCLLEIEKTKKPAKKSFGELWLWLMLLNGMEYGASSMDFVFCSFFVFISFHKAKEKPTQRERERAYTSERERPMHFYCNVCELQRESEQHILTDWIEGIEAAEWYADGRMHSYVCYLYSKRNIICAADGFSLSIQCLRASMGCSE